VQTLQIIDIVTFIDNTEKNLCCDRSRVHADLCCDRSRVHADLCCDRSRVHADFLWI